MKITKSFTVTGNGEKIFELIQSFMSAMKYQIVNANSPNILVLKRGSKHPLFSFKIENLYTELNISLKQKGENVQVLCDYDFPVRAIYTSSDMSTIESEVERLKNFLETTTYT